MQQQNTQIYLCHKRDRFTSSTSPSCPANSMDVIFAMRWNIKVYNNINMWYVQTPINKWAE